MTIKIAIMIVKVSLAYLEDGSRNAITPLLTASTPVMAVQPLEKARSISQALMASVAVFNLGGAATAMGCPPAATVFNKPIAIAASRHPMNKYVGNKKR